MKFKGELRFPEIDHPGVPVDFVIEDQTAEILVEGETLGRWSLFDVHARRLVSSAFSIDLDGAEVTFIAADPIDFAYRGVDHMAKAWAAIKAKNVAGRSLAIRKSRRDTIPSRIEDMKAAMRANLDGAAVGEARSASSLRGASALGDEPERQSVSERIRRATEMPDSDAVEVEDAPIGIDPDDRPIAERLPDAAAADADVRSVAEELEEERRRLAEERALLEAEKKAAAEREANLLEAYRLEVERLEAERAALRQQQAESDAVAEEEPRVEPMLLPEPVAEEPEPVLVEESEPVLVEEAEPEPVLVEEPEPEPVLVEEPEPEPEEELVDLSGLEVPQPETDREPEPALAGVVKEKSGLMGAVKAAFKGGTKDHTHQFVEAPGGLGITRYVCEECAYVSISTGS